VILFCILYIQGHDSLREIVEIRCVNLPKKYLLVLKTIDF